MNLTRSSSRLLRQSLVRAPRPATALRLRALATAAAQAEEHDLVIVGGGPAGLVLASALASSSAIRSTSSITLIEGSKLDKVEEWAPAAGEFSNRVSSITAENVAFLQKIGVWSELDHSRTRGIESMRVWDGLTGAAIEFDSPLAQTPDGTPAPFSLNPPVDPMATLVENLNLQRGALRQLRRRPGAVELVDASRVGSIEEGEGGWPVVHLQDAKGEKTRSLRARLLIGADGANSPVKAYSKIDTFGRMYDTHGIVASMKLEPGARYDATHTAFQRFLPEGPIAFLPLGDTAASLVWSTTPQLAAIIKTLPPSTLAPLINAAFILPYDSLSELLAVLISSTKSNAAPLDQAAFLDRTHALLATVNTDQIVGQAYVATGLPPRVIDVQPGSAQSFPLRLSHTSSYLGEPKKGRDARTVLVGDAAHTIHPLAGQGLNMGLADVNTLVNTLEGVVRQGGDVGAFTGLRPYPRSRYVQNHALLSACDHLHTLFGTSLAPMVWARSTGLQVLNEFDSVKSLLMGGAGSNAVDRAGGPKAGAGGTAWAAVGKAVQGALQAREIAGAVGGMAWSRIKSELTRAR